MFAVIFRRWFSVTDKKTFGSFIKAKRLEKNYSQKDLAELLFVTEGAVSKWERGISYPDITLVSDICSALDISEHEFITASTDTETRKIKQEAKIFRRIRGAWIWSPTVLYATALVVCFICNLAIGHTLSWFFIVLSSLMCAYSFIPTFTWLFKTKKFLVFTVTTYLSIVFLLFICAVYTNGMYWLLTACIGVLMGYVLVFLPAILSKTKLSSYKFVISFSVLFVLTVLLLLAVNIWNSFSIVRAILMTAYGFSPLVFCAVVCLFDFDGFIKTGICTLFTTAIVYFTNYVAGLLFGVNGNQYQVDFNNWEQCTNGNIFLIFLIVFSLIGIALVVTGISRSIKSHER